MDQDRSSDEWIGDGVMRALVVCDARADVAIGAMNREGREKRENARDVPLDEQARVLHRRFQVRRRQQAAWDAEEARDLRAAETLRLWEAYGCVTLVEYLEVRCGIEARAAFERIRVARALAELPLVEARLEEGAFAYSHVRELTRVVVAETEAEWVAHTQGRSYREVTRALAGHVRGDRPCDPTEPDHHLQQFGLRVKPSTYARLAAALRRLEDERGERFVDDDDKAIAICAALEGGASGESVPAQVWLTDDGRAFANGVELDAAEAATLVCDADVMGHVADPNSRKQPSLSRKQRRRIATRDGNCCRVPSCRSRRHLDIHHIVHREHGGDDADPNLVLLCHGHHALHHRGRLLISGRAPDALVFERRGDE